MCPSVDSKGIQQRMRAWNGFSTLLRLRKWHLHAPEGWTEGKGGYGEIVGSCGYASRVLPVGHLPYRERLLLRDRQLYTRGFEL